MLGKMETWECVGFKLVTFMHLIGCQDQTKSSHWPKARTLWGPRWFENVFSDEVDSLMLECNLVMGVTPQYGHHSRHLTGLTIDRYLLQCSA